MTLAQARTRVRRHLDDAGDTPRWTDDEIREEIIAATSSVLEEYVRRGGERFDEQVEVEATSGVASIGPYDPVDVRSVAIDTGADLIPIESGGRHLRQTADTSTRDLVVMLVRRPEAPTVDDDLLVPDARTWADFDALICAKAAVFLCPKDNDNRIGKLGAVMEECRRTVMDAARVPRSYERRDSTPRTSVWRSLRCVWLPGPRTITLFSGGR